MDFRTATGRLSPCVTQESIAEAAGTSLATIKQARADPMKPSWRPPPAGWQAILARLARERAGEVVVVAEELVKGSGVG
jgi:hypothetical protein